MKNSYKSGNLEHHSLEPSSFQQFRTGCVIEIHNYFIWRNM